MAGRGRPPKPTALKVLEGNPGKRDIPKEVTPPKGDIKCPPWLLPYAKKEWKRMAGPLIGMGVLTMADLEAFAAYCQSYARWREAEEYLTKYGTTFETPSGYQQQRPQVSIANSNLKAMHQFMTEFGLTPVSRARIGQMGGESGESNDPMEQLLSGGWDK